MSADDVLILWVIYDHPRDYSAHFVVRRHFVKLRARSTIPASLAPFGTVPTDEPRIEIDRDRYLAGSLDDARDGLPPGLTRLAREIEDDPCIVEVWI